MERLHLTTPNLLRQPIFFHFAPEEIEKEIIMDLIAIRPLSAIWKEIRYHSKGGELFQFLNHGMINLGNNLDGLAYTRHLSAVRQFWS